MSYIMAMDQGTSSSRAILFDAGGDLVALAQREFDCLFPQEGWVEQDPEQLWQTSLSAAREVIEKSGIGAHEIAGLGITNQRETTLVWDAETSEPVYNAIVWQDRRTTEYCNTIRAEGMEAEISEITGLLIDPYFSSTKLAWILEHIPATRQQAEAGRLRFGTVDSFLIWRLTKGSCHATDATNASRTQLFDINTQNWSEPLLSHFRIPQALLPEVKDCVADFGHCDAEWFGAEIPILSVVGDQQAALVGQACFHPGMTKSTYGTGCFVISNTGEERIRSRNRLLSTVAYRLGGNTTYALEGSIFVAGVAMKWLRDRLHLIRHVQELEAAAEHCGPDTGGVYLVPAFTGLGAPHWRPDARGLICGLGLDTTREQILTAALESVGFQTLELLRAMAEDGAAVNALRVDGGMVVNNWLCQFLADLLEVDVERPRIAETTAFGAALLAGMGAGWFNGLDDMGRLWQGERTFHPAMQSGQRRQLLAGWQRAIDLLL